MLPSEIIRPNCSKTAATHNRNSATRKWCVPALLLALPMLARGQTVKPQVRITQAVNPSQLTVLRGNTHPLARAEFDRGAAPADLPMNRMLLVLKRSPAQEAALQTLLAQQQDKTSPNYHNWLTPQQFGQQFGVADQDIQAVTSWLQSAGFMIGKVANSRMLIEFSGNAAQVQAAFHTTIHKYVVNGEEHWANASDPQIPAALTPVVAGVNTLHNFFKKPASHVSTELATAKYVAGSAPQFTNSSNTAHFLAPSDYAVLYNINPLYNTAPTPIDGTGTTIGIVGRTNINPQDIANFRQLFGLSAVGSSAVPCPLPAATDSPATGPLCIVIDGDDPGIVSTDEESEALLDASWSGAVAPGATVDLVVSASTTTEDGTDLSEFYIIDNNIADVMSESFSTCEAFAGSSNASYYAGLAEEGAAQGITSMVSMGDAGSAGCDNPNLEASATNPVSVNVLASTPFTVAVGGTMFNEFGADANYWNPTPNNPTNRSSIKPNTYIPEDVWNESCAASQTGCLTPSIWAGGGGLSAFFTKPSWQTGVTGIPTTNARAVPDVSLTAAGHDGYLLCQMDFGTLTPCVAQPDGTIHFVVISGTSASSPSFTGMMALVKQKTGLRQGQADYVLYQLAHNQQTAGTNCDASSQSKILTLPNACVFNDVTFGSNDVPGETGYNVSSPNTSLDYPAGTGYDMATGLGSVNAANMVNNWPTRAPTMITFKLNDSTAPIPNLTHGTAVKATVIVASTSGTGTPSGDVSLVVQAVGIPDSGVDARTLGDTTNCSPALPANSCSWQTFYFPGGGPYNVVAHYEGDSTFAPKDSLPIAVTVKPEISATSETVFNTVDPTTGNPIALTSAAYGSPVFFDVVVSTSPNNPNPDTAPLGNVTFSDSLSSGGCFASGGGGPFALNSLGHFQSQNAISVCGVGSHSITAQYGGSNSYDPSSSAAAGLTITQAATTTSLSANPTGGTPGTSITLTANIASSGQGISPTGTVMFLDGMTTLGSSPVSNFAASFNTSTLAAGTHNISAKYNGDTNYTSSTSGTVAVRIALGSQTSVTASATTVPSFTNVTFTATVSATQAGGPALTGTVQFTQNGSNLGSPVTVPGNGQAQLTTTLPTVGTYPVTATYSGDMNYIGSSGSVNMTVTQGPDFTITASTNNVPVSAPGAVSPGVTLTVTGSNGYNGTISFSSSSCTITPAGSLSTCNFSAPSVTGSGMVSVSVATTAPSSVFPLFHPSGGVRLWIISLCAVMFSCVLLLALSRKQPRLKPVLGLLGFAVLALCLGCSSSSNVRTPQGGTPTDTPFTVTVAATASTGQSHTASFTFTVQ